MRTMMPTNPLFVPELFHYILDYLATSPSGGPENSEERKTLAALARTCTAFSQASLDRLWRRLDSLLPLVRCFADVVDEARVKTPPSPQEWFIINRYSSRVQELTLGYGPLSLHFLECTKLVLPNLKVLRWEYQAGATTTDREMASLWSLLTPRIVTLEVALTGPSDTKLQSFTENLTHLCPNLKSIKFDFFQDYSRTFMTLPTNASQALYGAICGYEGWQRVELSCAIDNVTLKYLGLSSTLRVASVTLDPEVLRADEACFGQADIPFRNVTRLALTAWSRLDIATLLLRPYDQAFHSFKVTLRNTQTTIMDIYALLTAIVSPQRIHSLRSFVIRRSRRHRHVPIPASEIQGLSYETLRPLVSLVHLRELNIALNYPIMIDDDDFACLVCNWPCLEVFRLMGRCEESVKAISLKGLLSLLAACPKLREIGLSLDARLVPSADVNVLGAGTDLCRPLVRRLSFQDSLINDPDPVAAFLFKHLPGVHRVYAGFQMLPRVQRRRLTQLWVRMNVHIRNRRQHEARSSQDTAAASVLKPST